MSPVRRAVIVPAVAAAGRFLAPLVDVRLPVERPEHHRGAEPLRTAHRVREQDVAEEDGEELSGGHHRGVQQRAKLLDGKGDEKLRGHRRQAQCQCIAQKLRVLPAEAQVGPQTVAHQQAEQTDRRRRQVHLLLEGGGEAVERQVHHHERQADPRTARVAVFGVDIAGQQEYGAADGHGSGHAIVHPAVPFAGHEGAPDEHRDHLGALAQRLRRHRHPHQRRVLRRGGHHIAHRHRRVFVQRGDAAKAVPLSAHRHDDRSRQRRTETVLQHQEERVAEEHRLALLIAALRRGHDPLLQVSVKEQRGDDAAGAHRHARPPPSLGVVERCEQPVHRAG
eukprot:ctg_313.g178